MCQEPCQTQLWPSRALRLKRGGPDPREFIACEWWALWCLGVPIPYVQSVKLIKWASVGAITGSQLFKYFGIAAFMLAVTHPQQRWVYFLCGQEPPGALSSRPLVHLNGGTVGVLAICCYAQIMWSLGAAGYIRGGGLEKIVHNLWSMWIIFLWHLKNSWQREKCWVKGNNPLLPSPSFGRCESCWKAFEKSVELDSSLCFPFIR